METNWNDIINKFKEGDSDNISNSDIKEAFEEIVRIVDCEVKESIEPEPEVTTVNIDGYTINE